MQKKGNLFLLIITVFFISCTIKNPVNNTKELSEKPIVILCIDDGYRDAYDVALPILKKFDYPVTFGIITSRPNNYDYNVTWEELDTLKTIYHWEIASHSVNHPHLDRLSDEEFIKQLLQSKQTLIEHGFKADTFIVPYGAMTEKQLFIAKNYYKNIRFAHDHLNVNPLYRYQLWGFELDESATFQRIRDRIDTSIEKKEPVLIIFFHHVKTNPDDYFDITPDKLYETLSIIKEKGLKVMTLSKAMDKILGNDEYK